MDRDSNADSPESMVEDASSEAAPNSATAGGGGSSNNPLIAAAPPPVVQYNRLLADLVGHEINLATQGLITSAENFAARVLVVNAGEDIILKILSVFGMGHLGVMVYSATGRVSEANVYQASAQGFVTIRNEWVILSLSATLWMNNPNTNAEPDQLNGNLTVSLLGPDERILIENIVKSLIAASSTQVVMATFMPRAYQAPPPRT